MQTLPMSQSYIAIIKNAKQIRASAVHAIIALITPTALSTKPLAIIELIMAQMHEAKMKLDEFKEETAYDRFDLMIEFDNVGIDTMVDATMQLRQGLETVLTYEEWQRDYFVNRELVQWLFQLNEIDASRQMIEAFLLKTQVETV